MEYSRLSIIAFGNLQILAAIDLQLVMVYLVGFG